MDMTTDTDHVTDTNGTSKGINLDGDEPEKAEMLDKKKKNYLYYGVNENPPLHVAMVCGIQVNVGQILHSVIF